MHLTHTQRQSSKCMGFFILLLVIFLHMQTYLGRVLKVALLVHLVLWVHIQCGWKMNINFATWAIEDGFLKIIPFNLTISDSMER